MGPELTIGAMSERTGVATSALRFYEAEGLISAARSDGGQRRYARDIIRRVSFILVAQQVGLTLDEIREALGSLPESRTPNQKDWQRLSNSWRPRIDARIAMLERLRDRLGGCIGCGCLSLGVCKLLNPDDLAAKRGAGPRYVLDTIDRLSGQGRRHGWPPLEIRLRTEPEGSVVAIDSSYRHRYEPTTTRNSLPLGHSHGALSTSIRWRRSNDRSKEDGPG